jgi:hypothetical protein
VIEARDGAIRSLPQLLAEAREARATRAADFAIAVVRDASNLPRQVGRFQPYEDTIVVAFDFFDVALRYARGVLTLRKPAAEGIDVQDVEKAINEVRTSFRRLTAARRQIAAIDKAADAAAKELASFESDVLKAVDVIDGLLRSDAA